MQSSQRPQSLLQPVDLMQGTHFAGSLIVAGVQSGLKRTSFVPPPGNSTEQQPKQSHPFGTPGMQKSMHCWLTMQSGSVAGLAPVRQSV
jgi:hypothetical protein